jgi:hypothetical protein
MPGALVGASILVAGGLAVGTTRAEAVSGGGCQLAGQASFSPGLGANAQPFTYSFKGNLTGCQASPAAPATGSVGAGNVVPETVTVTTATGPVVATFNYQQPVPSGNGGCSNSTTSGDAFTTWADGTQTAFGYKTTGAAAAVALQGNVLASVDLQPLPGQGITVGGVFYPAPTYTFTTNRFNGDTASGLLTFQPPDPTACNTPAGVTAAAIGGTVSLTGN